MKEVFMKIAIIGGGPGGYVAAIRAAQLNAEVALVEKDKVGGTCLNKGCIPTKVLLHASKEFAAAKNFESYGIKIKGAELDWAGIQKRKAEIVDKQVKGIEGLLVNNKVVKIKGEGSFISKNQLKVKDGDGSETRVDFDYAIIATGSKPFIIPIPGVDLPGVITSDESLDEIHIDILGKHQALNAMAAILAGRELGMKPEEIRSGLSRIEKTGLRNEVIKIDKCNILNDCYKSNPVSIMAALDIFDLFDSKKKIAVLGDMLGYREISHDIHYKAGRDLSSHHIDELVTIGQEAKFIAKGARENTSIKSIVEFDTKEEAASYLKKYLSEDCTILIKGSRFLKLEYIANKLKEWENE
jgi:UDP-N-acetylmuramyl pentapeptide synthase